MFNVQIEMPSGAVSQDHMFADEAEARKLFDTFVGQMKPWQNFSAVVTLSADGKQIDRTEITNAS